jgi:beta-galactosidase
MSERPRVERGTHLLRDGGRSILPVGAHLVPPEGPDWPWRVGPEAFARAFAQMAELGLDTVRIDVLWAGVEPREGEYDEDHLRALDEVLAAAREHGLRLHPALLVGGEVGDAFWDAPWRDGRHPHAHPELRRRQAEHVAALARRWRDDSSILAWDLTDEPPFWLHKDDTTDDDARTWTRALTEALRRDDPRRLITIGTASQEVDHGPFRADVVAGELDFACVHPYPIYSPELYPDALLSTRMTLAGAFETALAAGAGRPVMVHEYGASSAQFDPERIAAYDRLLTWSSLGRGAIGFYAWCWTDAAPAAYARAPYVRMPHETQFGVTDHEGGVRPRGRVLGGLAAALRRVDLDAHLASGPESSAAILVPHEYVRPYDPGAFGLEGRAAESYEPSERAWTPVRDPKPLVRGWLNAFVMAARADIRAEFPRERLDDAWPATRLLLLPAPLTTTTSSLLHLRTSFWRGAAAFFAAGGTLYASCSADTAIPGAEDALGCRIADRAPVGRGGALRFRRSWGPIAAGETLRLPASEAPLHNRGVRLELGGEAIVIAEDEAGDPALVATPRGPGWAVVCAFPVELLLADVPDAHGRGDDSWKLYAGLASLAGVRPAAGVDHPGVVGGVVRGERGGALLLTNHTAEYVVAPLRFPGELGAAIAGDGTAAAPPHNGEVALGPHAAQIITWTD